MNRTFQENAATLLLGIAILVVVGIEFILNLTPPISRDALIHHLAVPKLWLRHGGFYETPWANFSYYPMYINLLYLPCLYLKNDVAPKFIHLAFGLGTGGLIYAYLKAKYDRNWGLLGMLIFISTPIVIWLSTSAYIDLGMTFFTTGSVLAFVRWRDSEFKKIRWLLISSFCMGIAIGSKYNALIAFFIMNLLLMVAYVRRTRKQMGAVKYGLIFLAAAAAAASPWYVKNYLLTGNPFYPLFDSLFRPLHHQPIGEFVYQQATAQAVRTNFFQMRAIAYGETFWEILLIPLRMFFQGDDNSYQYFQGVLNPILIVFAPFIMMDRKHISDKSLFVLFVLIFIAVSYFTTLQQVRYILPVIPFLAILAVMGIKDPADRLRSETPLFFRQIPHGVKRLLRIALFAAVGILLSRNFLYSIDRLEIIKPWPYVSGRENREDFLKRQLMHYDAVSYINAHLSDDALIYQLFLGRRGYYLDRTYKNEPSFGMRTIQQMVDSSAAADEFREFVRSMGATHIMMRTDLVNKYLRDNFSEQEISRFMTLAKKQWQRIYASNGHAVWSIR